MGGNKSIYFLACTVFIFRSSCNRKMAVKTALLCLDGTKICSQSALMFVFKNLRDLVKHKLYVHIYSGM